jgi:hypothetical protein
MKATTVYAARLYTVYERVYDKAMNEMIANEHCRGWERLLREWADVPYRDLDWGARIFQKWWRGRCARLVVRRKKVQDMEAELQAGLPCQ